MTNANISLMTQNNTFGNWLAQSNTIANVLNSLLNGLFYADNGSIMLANGTITLLGLSGVQTLLSVSGNATISGNVTAANGTFSTNVAVGNVAVSQNIAVGNVTVAGKIFASNTLGVTEIGNTWTLNIGSQTIITIGGSSNSGQTSNNALAVRMVTGNMNAGSLLVEFAGGDSSNGTNTFGLITVSNSLVQLLHANATGSFQFANASGNVGNVSTVIATLYAANGTWQTSGNGAHSNLVATANTYTGNLSVTQNAAAGNLSVTQNVTAGNVSATLSVSTATLTVSGNASTGNLVISQNVSAGNASFANANVSGTANIGSLVVGPVVSGQINATGTLNVSSNVFTGNVSVTGNTVVSMNTTTGNLVINQNVSAGNASFANLNVSSTANLGSLVVGTIKSSSINATGTLNVSGATALNSDTSVTGNLTVSALSTTKNLTVTQNTETGNLVVDSAATITGGKLTANNIQLDSAGSYSALQGNLVVNNLTVQGTQTIEGTTTLASDTFQLRTGSASDGDGHFKTFRGATVAANADVKFNHTSGVMQFAANDAQTYSTILTTANIADSVTSNSTINAASANSVEFAFNTAVAAANTVAVYGAGGLILNEANLNFNNTATANLAAVANGTTQVNVSAAVNMAASYTWSGIQLFTGPTPANIGAVAGVTVGFTANTLFLDMNAKNSAANCGLWEQSISNANVLTYRVINDAYLNSSNWLVVTRANANIVSLVFGNSFDSPSYQFFGPITANGNLTLNGTLGITGTLTGAAVVVNTLNASGVINSTSQIIGLDVTATRNVSAGNASISGALGVTGTLTGAAALFTTVNASGIINTTSNMVGTDLTATRNVIAGNVSVTLNVAAGNVTTQNLNASGTINSVGQIIGLDVTATRNVIAGNVSVTLNIAAGNIVVQNVNATGQINTTSNLSAANVTVTRNVSTGNIAVTANMSGGNIALTGNITSLYTANTVFANVADAMTNAGVIATPNTATLNVAITNAFDITTSNAVYQSINVAFASWATTGNMQTVTVIVRQPGAAPGNTAQTSANLVNWTNSQIVWSNGEVPVLAGFKGKCDILTFVTVDGGAHIYGAHSMANVG